MLIGVYIILGLMTMLENNIPLHTSHACIPSAFLKWNFGADPPHLVPLFPSFPSLAPLLSACVEPALPGVLNQPQQLAGLVEPAKYAEVQGNVC